MLLEVFREYEHILFTHLSFLELTPCSEQIFFRDDMLKDIRMNPPPPRFCRAGYFS